MSEWKFPPGFLLPVVELLPVGHAFPVFLRNFSLPDHVADRLNATNVGRACCYGRRLSLSGRRHGNRLCNGSLATYVTVHFYFCSLPEWRCEQDNSGKQTRALSVVCIAPSTLPITLFVEVNAHFPSLGEGKGAGESGSNFKAVRPSPINIVLKSQFSWRIEWNGFRDAMRSCKGVSGSESGFGPRVTGLGWGRWKTIRRAI